MPATTPRPHSPEQVAAFDRNAWPRSIGIPGRNRRNPHPGPYWRANLSGDVFADPQPPPADRLKFLLHSLISISDRVFVAGSYEHTPLSVIVPWSRTSVSSLRIITSRSNETSNEIATSDAFGVA